MVNSSNFEKAMKAALEGPEVKKIKVNKHEFNVKPIKITGDRSTGATVKGQISHHLSMRDDDQVYYEFQLIAGQRLTINQMKVEIDGSFMNKITADLVDAVWDAFKEWLSGKAKEKLDFSTQKLATQPSSAIQQIYQESLPMLNSGGWEDEAKFLIVNIAGRLAVQTAQVVYRQTKPPSKPTKKTPPIIPPGRFPKVEVRDHRTGSKTRSEP